MPNHIEADDDIVIIKQKDKRGRLYIAIAAVVGIAFGGLVGAWLTSSHWQQQYQTLERSQQALQTHNEEIVVGLQNKRSQLEQAMSSQTKAALAKQKTAFNKELLAKNTEIDRLQALYDQSMAELKTEKSNNKQLISAKESLSQRNELQATMFEQAKDLFRKEAAIKHELSALTKERDTLVKNISKLKKECDVFLQGTSWDAKSDACEKQDAANSRLSQVIQMIKVHQLDLKQIAALNSKLGL